MNTTRRGLTVAITACAVALSATDAQAGSHLWRFNEIFSNADGTIQFIELHECCGSNAEVNLAGKWVLSDATGHQFFFPENLTPPTANKHLLLATAGFAALPGAPTPDYIIIDSFLTLGADTLRYWSYSAATMPYADGDLPSDGTMSLAVDGTVAVNSPTNYAGQTGSVNAGPMPIPTVSQWGFVTLALAVLAAGTIVFVRRSRVGC